MKTKYYLDTEFIERPNYLKLISIGLIDENNREYYAVSSEFEESDCNDWVKKNVLPYLINSIRKPELQIKQEILEFIGNVQPEFWGYYSDYDWVLFCWLFGAMIDLPKNFPMFCLDLKQIIYQLQNQPDKKFILDSLPKENDREHHALYDAKWIKSAHQYLNKWIE